MGAAIFMVAIVIAAVVLGPAPGTVTVAKARFSAPAKAPAAATRGGDTHGLAEARLPAGQRNNAPLATPGRTVAGVLIDDLDYDLAAVGEGRQGVPRVRLVRLPENIREIRKTAERKAVFFKSVLPLVLQANEQILADRSRLLVLQAQQGAGARLPAVDRLWLVALADRYATRPGDIQALLVRHDVVPPSLALAQAATESAWGTSRFAREGNAMFGEWTFNAADKGIVPRGRLDGQTYRVRAFETLYDSVQSYITNLNRHRAYGEFRALRAKLRATGQTISGSRLAGTLERYSERGAVYTLELQALISGNGLDRLDGARLNRALSFDDT